MNEYEKQAINFLEKTNTNLNIQFLKNDFYFEGDIDKRDIYLCTLTRDSRSYTFKFGNSLFNSEFHIGKKDDIKLKSFTRDQLSKQIKDFNLPLLINSVTNETIDNKKMNLLRCGFHQNIFDLPPSEKIKVPIAPSNYDILACLDVFEGDFKEFCSRFSYNEDSIQATKIYEGVIKQSNNLKILFNNNELQELSEIC